MSKAQLHSENPELLLYTEGRLHITVLGGVRLTCLDRLKVTIREKPVQIRRCYMRWEWLSK